MRTRVHIPGLAHDHLEAVQPSRWSLVCLGVFAVATLCVLLCAAGPALAQASSTDAPDSETSQRSAGEPGAQVLDSVAGVVNNQVILASDIDLEMRISRLLPITEHGDLTRAGAMERLTTRALIEQQILLEDPHGLEIFPKDVEDSLTELRQNLPACKLRDCATAEGWQAYLETLGLTPERVSEYWIHRMAVLQFIELRFRSGIRIAPEEIQKYYQETLVPRYEKREDVPPLAKVSQRIQEILLQQRVNELLSGWVKSLQEQGQVEILDPALRMQAPAGSGLGSSAGPSDAASRALAPEKGGRP